MTSRERFLAALLHKRPVKVYEPYQALGLIEEDLQQALGLDVEGLRPRKTMFGFPAREFNGVSAHV